MRVSYGLEVREMKVDREESGKILDAIDTVCINCVEDTLNNQDKCKDCPVRKLSESLEWDEAE